jgi:hypothetical protein
VNWNWLVDAIWNEVAVFGLIDIGLIIERYLRAGR